MYITLVDIVMGSVVTSLLAQVIKMYIAPKGRFYVHLTVFAIALALAVISALASYSASFADLLRIAAGVFAGAIATYEVLLKKLLKDEV